MMIFDLSLCIFVVRLIFNGSNFIFGYSLTKLLLLEEVLFGEVELIKVVKMFCLMADI